MTTSFDLLNNADTYLWMNSINKSYDPDPSILGANCTTGEFNFRAATFTVLALPKEGQLPAKMETNKKKFLFE